MSVEVSPSRRKPNQRLNLARQLSVNNAINKESLKPRPKTSNHEHKTKIKNLSMNPYQMCVRKYWLDTNQDYKNWFGLQPHVSYIPHADLKKGQQQFHTDD